METLYKIWYNILMRNTGGFLFSGGIEMSSMEKRDRKKYTNISRMYASATQFPMYQKIRVMDPMKLTEALILEYMRQVSTRMESPEDLNSIGILLGELANARTYLSGIYSQLQAEARIAKRDKEHKREAEDMAIRRDAVETVMDSVKAQYDACSRMLTAHKMQIDELRMLNSQ